MEDILAESPNNIMYIGFGDVSNVKGQIEENTVKLVKLQLRENILAYVENKELIRDSIKPLECSSNLLDNVTSNYIIAKEILSNLSWQDKLSCKLVCSTWRSAVHALQKEQLSPKDFVVDLRSLPKDARGKGWFKQSGVFSSEPLVIFTFANRSGFFTVCKCEHIIPKQCEQPCQNEHCLLDLINRQINAPKNCMLTVKANFLMYKPLPLTNTYEHAIDRHRDTWVNPFVAGIFIPKIPNVGFQVINILSEESLLQEFYEVVDKVSKDNIVKGLLVYVTENYLLDRVENIVFLNYVKDVQPDVPYALGGCIIEDTMSNSDDIKTVVNCLNEGTDYVSENFISIGLFTVPKNMSDNEYKFEMYSVVVDSSVWVKPKIELAITEFSNTVPRFEHSVALKLSCVGRDRKHILEQDCFRAAFPDTPIVGCYGNGELGINYPAKSESLTQAAKKLKPVSAVQGIMYSYATVFVYFGWGKITSPRGPVV